jgi:hypothetical protein
MTTPDLTRDLEPAATVSVGLTSPEAIKNLIGMVRAEAATWRFEPTIERDPVEEAGFLDVIANTLSTLSEPAAPAGAEVVALEWHLSDDSERWVAARPFGEYIIVRDHRASAETTHGWFNAGRWDWFGSLAEAKAAAQRDFEARIRSTLATPQPVEPPDDTLNDIAAGDEAARDDEWGEAGE